MKKLFILLAIISAPMVYAYSTEKQADPALVFGIAVSTQSSLQEAAQKIWVVLRDVPQATLVKNSATIRLLQKDAMRVLNKLSAQEIVQLAVLHEYLGDLERAAQYDSFNNQTRYNTLRDYIKNAVNATHSLTAQLYLKRVLISEDVVSLMNLMYLAEDHFAARLYNRLMADRDARMYLNGSGRFALLRGYVIHAVKKLSNKKFEALALSVNYPNENRFTDQKYTQFAAMSKQEFKHVLDDACNALNKLINTSMHAGLLFEILEKSL